MAIRSGHAEFQYERVDLTNGHERLYFTYLFPVLTGFQANVACVYSESRLRRCLV